MVQQQRQYNVSDGAKKLYRDSKLGLTVQTILAFAVTAGLEWLDTLPALGNTAIGVAVASLTGFITAWRAKHLPPAR